MARRPALAALALLFTGCNGDEENPFANAPKVAPLRASNAIVLSSNVWAPLPRAPREVYGVDVDGANLTRVTFCNGESTSCDNLEAVPDPAGDRLAVRRITSDTDKDGRVGPPDVESLFLVDPVRLQEGELTLRIASSLPPGYVPTPRVSGVDWAPDGSLLLYAAIGQGEVEDLFRTVPRQDPEYQQTGNLSGTPGVRERRPRMDPSGRYLAYERIEGDRGEVWLFASSLSQARVTAGGTVGEPLAGTPYRVGYDADPDFSPDGRFVVFRRLTSTGLGGIGTWDLMTAVPDGTNLTTIATGALHRGAPDWGQGGILVAETDAAGSRVVVMQPDGSGRRVVLSAPAGYDVSAPRWRR
jgi:Tol biopolymer transport system component